MKAHRRRLLGTGGVATELVGQEGTGGTHMKRILVLTAAAAFALNLAGVTPAAAFLPGQEGVISASQELRNTVEIKKKFKIKKAKKYPPGWAMGRKVGWGGGSAPPGQRYR
jgi:hypothetical protein